MILSRLVFHDRPARPGDLVWLDREADPRDAQEETTFVRVWFAKIAKRGSALVLEDGGYLFWSRRVRVRGKPRALTWLGSLMAWDRPGQALLAREVARVAAVGTPLPPGPPDRFARARGGLPLIRAFGGQRRGYLGFWLHRAWEQTLRRMTGWPDPGFLDDSGVLVSRCSATLRFAYGGNARHMRLEQIRHHPNGNFHFMGHLLPSGAARTFNYSGISGLEIEGHPPVNPQELWVELNSLTASALSHHQVWAGWCQTHGLPLPPAPGLLAHLEEALRRLGARVVRSFPRTNPLTPLIDCLAWAWAELQPLPGHSPAVLAMDAPWRDGLRRAAWRMERGLDVDPHDLEQLEFLAQDRLFARALLRGMLVYEVRHGSPNRWALKTLNAALSLLPPGRRVFTWAEVRAARNFFADLSDDLIMLWRWPPQPYGKEDRPELLAALAVGAVHGMAEITRRYPDDPPFPPQEPIGEAFVQALLAFAAVPDEGWIVKRAQAPRWRWLAGFMPGD